MFFRARTVQCQLRSLRAWHSGSRNWRQNKRHTIRWFDGSSRSAGARLGAGTATAGFVALTLQSCSCETDDNPGMLPLAVHTLPADLSWEHFCNSGDDLIVSGATTGSGKLIWHFRHGQSTGNVAKAKARAKDGTKRGGPELAKYEKDPAYIDAPLTPKGMEQAQSARQAVAKWRVKPALVVCSPLTRAIQTAAIIFRDDLKAGTTKLIIRPELREFFPHLLEDRGRPITELKGCPELLSLEIWPVVKEALSDEATAEWRVEWDKAWARGSDGKWQAHCNDPNRLVQLNNWLAKRPETTIATMSHWGTINNLLNREPWADNWERTPVGKAWGISSWPTGGLARRFEMGNCGWIALGYSPRM
eukprot:gnl/MRDRNA2_/MRDRNA2_33412_c0_seq1.p1 gnl/MRDRNA2_/MRDRNA2_33412_c0~~gnl/MRDRNA2_/MRDRNA2_33412_c0_seq1.p1  ORF type:complete len:361 (-),score=52.99 gnl/MRDRNA2_/MRDRNA2_33412_c0_seq1:286-1368(-)